MEVHLAWDDIPALISTFTGDEAAKAGVLEHYLQDPGDFHDAAKLVAKMIVELGGIEKSKKWQDATPLRNRLDRLQSLAAADKRLISRAHVAVALAALGIAVHFRDQSYFNALAQCDRICRLADQISRPKWTRNRRFANMVQPDLPT